MRVHPIQLTYQDHGDVVACDLCQEISAPRHRDTPARVTHLVHLVTKHLPEVQKTFSAQGRAEEMEI